MPLDATQRAIKYRDRETWIMEILADSNFPPSTKVTGTRLAMHMNIETDLINPSIACLARETAQSARSVDRAIRALEKAGRISWEGRGHVSNKYTLLFPLTEHATTPHAAQLDTATTPPAAANNANRGAQPRHLWRANLVNLELNLTGDRVLSDLRKTIGERGWKSICEGTKFEPPRTLIFSSEFRRDEFVKRHGKLLGGIVAEPRSAA